MSFLDLSQNKKKIAKDKKPLLSHFISIINFKFLVRKFQISCTEISYSPLRI